MPNFVVPQVEGRVAEGTWDQRYPTPRKDTSLASNLIRQQIAFTIPLIVYRPNVFFV